MPTYAALSRGLTFTWVSFTLLWFWSTWNQLFGFLRLLGPAGTTAAFLAVFIVATISLAGLKALQDRMKLWNFGEASPVAARYTKIAFATIVAAATISVAVVLNAPAPHIVYKAF
jgi:hypothetical protein